MSAPSVPRIQTQQLGATRSESSDDHFSSASEGANSASHSPIPHTRVERVDDRAAYGEVPGTPAYDKRTRDAVPDEIEIIPDGQRSRSMSRARAMSQLSAADAGSRPQTPGGTPIPKTVVEKVDDKPSYGEVEGTAAREMRLADAAPDEVRRAPDVARASLDGSPEDAELDTPLAVSMTGRRRSMGERESEVATGDENNLDQDDDDFGDDFDDFAEGGGDDFDDIDDASVPKNNSFESQTPQPSDILAGLPPLEFSSCTTPDEIQEVITPYMTAIFPDAEGHLAKQQRTSLDPSAYSPFLSERSLSLWQQLVSPAPMQPPNWTRSKIRRLFLVSLGVPVDLDEILPPSKQKRLVLPNVNFERGSPRQSTSAVERLKEQGANDSSTSVDSKGQPRPSKPKRSATAPKGPTPPPDFDSNAAALLCRTTDEALAGQTDDELREHVAMLQALNGKASLVLEYWLQRKDEGLREKEALEGVIENLVCFVKDRRGK